GRAIELAERLGEDAILVHALISVGTAELSVDSPDGAEKLTRSLALALEAGLEEHVARGHANFAARAIRAPDYGPGDRHLAAGIEYCSERDLDSWLLYMTGFKARSELDQGLWDEAAASAIEVLDHPGVAAPTQVAPLLVLALLRARRGDSDPWSLLDE